MKDFWDWFIGRTASNAFYQTWQWLWGAIESMPEPEATPTAAEMESDALISLRSMFQSIEQLELAVVLVREHYTTSEHNYRECQKQIANAKQALANKTGLEAKLATGRIAILAEAAAQFTQQLQAAEENLCTATNQLLWEQQRAIAAQQQLTQASAMQVLNASILTIAQQRDSLATDSAQSQFDRATAALALAAEQQKVLAETIDSPSPVLRN